MKSAKTTFFVILLGFFVFNQAVGQEWELELEKEGISVYTRNVPDKKYKEFKASATIDASVHSLLAVLKNVEDMPEWLKQCEEAKLLLADDFWHQLSYHEIKVPVFKNRDMILEMTMEEDPNLGAIRINMNSRPDYIAEQKRKIRVQEVEGYWICKPLPSGKTYVEYGMYLDPAGIIPAWLYNMRIKNDPFNTLNNLRETVKKSDYSQAFYQELITLAKQ